MRGTRRGSAENAWPSSPGRSGPRACRRPDAGGNRRRKQTGRGSAAAADPETPRPGLESRVDRSRATGPRAARAGAPTGSRPPSARAVGGGEETGEGREGGGREDGRVRGKEGQGESGPCRRPTGAWRGAAGARRRAGADASRGRPRAGARGGGGWAAGLSIPCRSRAGTEAGRAGWTDARACFHPMDRAGPRPTRPRAPTFTPTTEEGSGAWADRRSGRRRRRGAAQTGAWDRDEGPRGRQVDGDLRVKRCETVSRSARGSGGRPQGRAWMRGAVIGRERDWVRGKQRDRDSEAHQRVRPPGSGGGNLLQKLLRDSGPVSTARTGGRGKLRRVLRPHTPAPATHAGLGRGGHRGAAG